MVLFAGGGKPNGYLASSVIFQNNKEKTMNAVRSIVVGLLCLAAAGTFAAGEPVTSVAVGESTFGQTELDVALAGIGLEAASATISVSYGTVPTSLTETAEVTVDRPGETKVPLTGLQAGCVYYAHVTVRNDSDDSYECDLSFVQPTLIEAGGDPRLPTDYSPLVKLTSTGAEYIATDFVPDAETGTEFSFGEVTYKASTAFFGQGWAGSQYMLDMQSDKFYWHGAPTALSAFSAGCDYKMTVEPSAATTDTTGILTLSNVTAGTGQTWSSVSLGVAQGAKLNIFGMSNGYKAPYSLYSLKMTRSGATVADFIPAREEGTGDVGLYDAVARKFYASKTTTPFADQPVRDCCPSLTLVGDSLRLELPASASARTVTLLGAATYGGVDLAQWTVLDEQPATAEAGTVEFKLPDAWGETATYVRAYITEENVGSSWSKSVVYSNPKIPSATLTEVDGTGGDTLVLRGIVQSFAGDDCTLTVRLGSSSDDLSEVWTDLDGSVLTRPGAFELPLHESDPAAARYLRGGSTLYVTVEATANGQASRTETKSVTLKGAAVYATATASVKRRAVTFTGSLADCGTGGKAVVTLWVGEGTNPAAFEQVGGPLEITDGTQFSFAKDFELFEHDYGWQFRAETAAVGGTTNFVAASAVQVAHTIDDTTYIWKGGAKGDWCDAANWQNTYDTADRMPYPQSPNASVSFRSTAMRVRLTRPITINSFGVLWSGQPTIYSEAADPSAVKLTAASFGDNGTGGIIMLSNVVVTVTSGGPTIGGGGRRFVIDGGSDFYLGGNIVAQDACTFEVRNGSKASVNNLYIGGGNVDQGGAVIADSTLEVRGAVYLGNKNTGGSIRFEGEHPLLKFTTAGGMLYSNLANAGTHLDFLVPVGGYDVPPIAALTEGTIPMGNWSATKGGSSTFSVNVLEDSPAARAGETIVTTLVDWPIGVNTNLVQAGALPTEAVGSEFVWTGDNAGRPTALEAKIVGAAHGDWLDIVSSTGSEIGGAGVSPAYGTKTGLEANEPVYCTAPSACQTVTDTVRATCTGWKTYVVDPLTRQRTFEASGSGTTYEYVHDGRWHQLEWQWQEEFLVTVTAGAGGTVSPASQWVTNGSAAVVTATAEAGKAFSRWSGDMSDGGRFSSTFAVTAPVEAEAVFGNLIYVATPETGGSDTEGDGTSAKPYATIAKGLSEAVSGDQVVVGKGTYLQTAGLTLPSGVLLRGATGDPADVVVKATGGANNTMKVLTINDADSGVFDLTLDGDETYTGTINNFRTPLEIAENGGRANNCILRNGYVYFVSGGNMMATGVGIKSERALVTRCVIISGRAPKDPNSCGAIYGCGKVANCLIVGNEIETANSAIVNLTAGGLMENCTFVANEVRVTSSALHIKADPAAKVVNCVFADNLVCGEPGLNVKAEATVFERCAFDVAPMGEDGIRATASAMFKDPAHDDWEPKAGSPLVNAGVWPTLALDTDLAGRPRIVDGAIDVGAYEPDLSVFDFTVTVDRPDGVVPGDYTFTAAVGGCSADDEVAYLWDFDGDGSADATTTVPQYTRHFETPGAQSVTLTVRNDTKGLEKTLTFENLLTLLPRQILVADGNEHAAYPYATWETAASNLQSAIDAAVEGCEVVVSNGVYEIPGKLAPTRVDKPVTVRSLTGRPKDVTIVGDAKTSCRLVLLNHAKAVLSGVTVDAGSLPRGNDRYRTPVYIDVGGGQVTNCVIQNGFQQSWGNWQSSAVFMGAESALVTHCVISNCWQLNDRDRGVIQLPGRLSNCLIVGCGTKSTPIVSMTGKAVMESCTFVANDATASKLHLGLASTCRVRNSIFAANTIDGEPGFSPTALSEYQMSAYEHCLCDSRRLGVDGEAIVAPASDVFGGRRPWRLKPGSPAVDVVPEGEAGPQPSVGLDGRSRIFLRKLDLGCYELQNYGTTILVR